MMRLLRKIGFKSYQHYASLPRFLKPLTLRLSVWVAFLVLVLVFVCLGITIETLYDLGIPVPVTILMFILAIVMFILFLAWVEWSAQKKRIEMEERELKLKLKTIKCPNCGHEQSKDLMTCEQCGKMVKDNRFTKSEGKQARG